MTALLATILAALIAGPAAIYIKGRIDKRTAADHAEQDETKKAKADLAVSVDKRLDRLLNEQDRLRDTYRSEVDDLRARVRLLEQEVAEWRSGMHGVVGVWVAVPAWLWDFVRTQLPDLPTARLPGEAGHVPDDHT